jgi:hypothetical protein
MAVPWTAPELADRYSPHVEELRDFFAMQHLHCGSPEDLMAVAARLDASDSFREDLSSMVRVILLREGGSVPRADLLEIVTVAIAGDDIDEATADIQQTVIQPPVQQIFAFLNGVLRKPWNLPPGEERLQPEPMSTAEAIPGPDRVQTPGPQAPAISEHEEVHVSRTEDGPAESLVEAQPASAANFVRPESIYSRFATLAAEMQPPATRTAARTEPEPALEAPAASEPSLPLAADVWPDRAAAIALEAPPPEPLPTPAQLIHDRKVVPWPRVIVEPRGEPRNVAQHNAALEQMPTSVPNIFFPPPLPSAATLQAAEPRSHPATLPPPPSTLDPEPPSPSVFPPIRRPNFDFIRRPEFSFIRRPNFNLKAVTGRISASQLRVASISGAAAILFVAALMYTARRHADTVLGATRAVAQPAAKPITVPAPSLVPDNPPAAAAAEFPAATEPAAADPIPKPAPSAAHKTHRLRDDGYIAPPYSTPIPPELAVHPPTPHTPSGSNQATAGPVGTASDRSDH